MTREEHIERFEDCVNYSEKRLPEENIENFISKVCQLEDIKDVSIAIPALFNE